ncbi:MAG: protease-4 [bacterium]|jgi:protease-4
MDFQEIHDQDQPIMQRKTEKKSWISKHPVLTPIFILLILIFGISLLSQKKSKPKIGVVLLEGTILSSEPIIKQLRDFENDPQIRGIILRVNSPGGAVAPSQEIYEEVLRIQKKKLIYTSIASVAASGGYYIAIASKKIYANAGSITGSIGVIMQSFNVQKLMEKVGVQSLVIKSGKNKDVGSMFRTMTPEEKLLLQSLINDTQDQFVTAVAKHRKKLDRKKVETLADGRIFTGRQALKEGLIDGLATFRQVISTMEKQLKIQNAQLVYPKKKEEMLKKLFDMVSPIQRVKNKIQNSTGLFFLAKM